MVIVNLDLSPVEYIEYQLRLLLGNEVNTLSKGQLKILSYFYKYRNVKEASSVILDSKLRTSKKSIANDLTTFGEHGLKWLKVQEGNIEFIEAFRLKESPDEFLVKIKVN